MMRLAPIIGAAAYLLASAHPARAECFADIIDEATDSGSILVMMSGAAYDVLPGDEADAMLWLPATDVLVCPRLISRRGRSMVIYEIINTDDHETISATRLR